MKMNSLIEIWSECVNAGEVDQVCRLYADDARLLATFASEPIDSKEGIRDYFKGFTSREGAGVSFESHGALKQTLGNGRFLYTGTYAFFHGMGHDRVQFPARYSFLVDETAEPLILHHHSSLVPSA